MQGVLQNLTSTVGSAASTVSSTVRSGVNRLTGEQPSDGLSGLPGSTVSFADAPQMKCMDRLCDKYYV